MRQVRRTRLRRCWRPAAVARTLSDMTSGYADGTAHPVVMSGPFGPEGPRPRQTAPAPATIGWVNGQSRKALCGAYVTIDEKLPWPPEGYDEQQLSDTCATLASL